MISVIIPCYNAEPFIEETIQSILSQTDAGEMEVIVIDDGSTDNSASIVNAIGNTRISYVYQENKGVSAARNHGLNLAKGTYIVFFDADDKMSPGFLKKRVEALEANGADFAGGPVHSFPVQTDVTFGMADHIAEHLLTYNTKYCSCPSNYLIQKKIIADNKILFNEKLSSTADRFYLIELAENAKGVLIEDAPLYYRINPESMSNKLSKKLIMDNELFLKELGERNMVPNAIKETFFFRIWYILGSGFIKTGSYFKGIRYSGLAFFKNPVQFLKLFFSRR